MYYHLNKKDAVKGIAIKRRHTNRAMAWIDYKKAYDMVTHSWISAYLEIFGIANNAQDFLNNSTSLWKLELNYGN